MHLGAAAKIERNVIQTEMNQSPDTKLKSCLFDWITFTKEEKFVIIPNFRDFTLRQDHENLKI